MKRLITVSAAIVTVVLGLWLLSGSEEEKIRYVLIEKIVEHTSKLRVPVPLGYEARDFGDYLYLAPAGLSSRSSVTIEFAVVHDPPSDAVNAETRKAASVGQVFSCTTRKEGGMGGPEYTLEAWQADTLEGAPVWIYLEAHTQVEWGGPDFSLAWALFEATSLGRTSELLDGLSPTSPPQASRTSQFR